MQKVRLFMSADTAHSESILGFGRYIGPCIGRRADDSMKL